LEPSVSLDEVEDRHSISHWAQDRVAIGCEQQIALLVYSTTKIRKLG
jgi:hypothetical protein